MAAPAESPTNRTPSGPMARAPADLSAALPVCMVVAPKANTAAQQAHTANRDSAETRMDTLPSSSWKSAQCYHIRVAAGVKTRVQQSPLESVLREFAGI